MQPELGCRYIFPSLEMALWKPDDDRMFSRPHDA